MNELRFRGREQYRVSGRRLAVLIGVAVLQLLLCVVRIGVVGAWISGAIVLFGAGAGYLAFRASTTVDTAGITITWFGSGRSYPWQEIQWIDVREVPGGAGAGYTARIHLRNGRRRNLPGLQHSELYPSPNFGTNLQQLNDWWYARSLPAGRIRPQPKFRDRHPQGFVWLIVLPATLVLVLVTIVFVVTSQG
ncbi:hypothetical protein ACFW1A_15760 [Kitasatospora sp. NPDC058965]|uniref:hypothetical protein n=1 Tax=Kitasatospora sp. NPDC058965 TaxID=3346682 RepID=UPI00369F9015